MSWLTIYGAYVILLSVVCIIILPLAGVFKHANNGIVFVLFVIYGFSSIVLALLMTPFFSKAKTAGAVGTLVQLLMSLLFYIQVFVGDSIDSVYYWLMALMSPCAFSMGIDKILLLDVTAGGLSFDTIWYGPGLPFAGSLIMVSVDVCLYLLLALYFDAIVPTEYGTREKPWFFLQPSFWRKEKKATGAGIKNRSASFSDIPNATGVDYSSLSRHSSGRSNGSSCIVGFTNVDIEPVSEDMRGKEAVIIRGLTKTYEQGRGKEPLHAVQGNIILLNLIIIICNDFLPRLRNGSQVKPDYVPTNTKH